MITTLFDRKSTQPKGFAAFSDSETLYNCRVKRYSDGGCKATFACSSIYKDKGFVKADVNQKSSSSCAYPVELSEQDEEEIYLEKMYKYRKDSLHRSRDAVFDIVRMNQWDWFFTGTLNDDCGVDRYNADEVCKAVNRFMYNCVKNGNVVRYIFVPEEHQDGAIHYHGFIKLGKHLGNGIHIRKAFNQKTGRWVMCGKGKDRRQVYNWLDWDFGFTYLSAVVGTNYSCAAYMTKYITKSADCPMKHRYYCGGDVVRDVPIEVYDVPFKYVPLDEVSTEFGCFKYISFDDYNSFLEFLQVIYNHSLGG